MINLKIHALEKGFRERVQHAEYMLNYSANDSPILNKAYQEQKNKCYAEMMTFGEIVAEIYRLQAVVEKVEDLRDALFIYKKEQSDKKPFGLLPQLLDEANEQFIKGRREEQIERENAENEAMEQALNFDKAEWKYRYRFIDKNITGEWSDISKADFDYRCKTYGIVFPLPELPHQISISVSLSGIQLEKYKVIK